MQGTVVNQELPSSHGGSLEIALTAPVNETIMYSLNYQTTESISKNDHFARNYE